MKLLGDKAVLTCSVGSTVETDKVKWKFNDNDLIVDNIRLKQPSNSKLEINDLKYSDSGVYSCYADSKFLSTILLTIEGKFQFFLKCVLYVIVVCSLGCFL